MRLLLAILLLLVAIPAHAQGQGQGMSRALVVSSCSSATLPAGSVTNLTMDPQGKLCLTGISGTGGCAQATNYLARTVGGNEGGNPSPITTLICGLVTDGLIDGTLTGATGCGTKLDALYVLAQQNQADAQLNLCGTSYGLTSTSLLRTLNFISYVGFNLFSSVNVLATGFDPSVAPSPKYTTNNAGFGLWSYGILVETNAQMGRSDNTSIYNKFSDGNFIAAVNGSGFPRTPNLITRGLFTTERSDASNVHPYQNGVSAGAISNASGADTGNFFIGGLIGPNYTDQTLSEAHIGASLGSAGNLALYNRLRTYMSAVGVP